MNSMGTYAELESDWSTLSQDTTYWTQADLQLAAELGKTLLERNKELETKLKHYQNIVEDRNQEIGYLTKQATALREVNDSRLRIYEQLEVSIQELERANHRLLFESASDKKQIKNLTASIEALEQKCEDLQLKIEDLNLQADIFKRKAAKPQDGPCPNCKGRKLSERLQEDEEKIGKNGEKNRDTKSRRKAEEEESIDLMIANEQVVQLSVQLKECRNLYEKEQIRGVELEEQLASMVKQHQVMEKQVTQLSLREDQSKSMHEELSSLDEFRGQGLCCRCLRTIGSSRASETMSFLDDEPEDDDDDLSLLNALNETSNIQQHCTTFSMEIQEYPTGRNEAPQNSEPNLYRELVEKYEALLEIQRNQTSRKSTDKMSLQEELQASTNFRNKRIKDTDDESGHGDSLQPDKTTKKDIKSLTPTDFSEAETSSSGFSDETSNKATQTEGNFGSFLCTFADGEDCKFSIYDDTSALQSRFHNSPEYREVFSEIFAVLKKAAEKKATGEQLPLLDDPIPDQASMSDSITPNTTIDESITQDSIADDAQSVLSEISTTKTEPITINEKLRQAHAKHAEPVVTKNDEPKLTPYVRQPLEYLSIGVKVRKPSSKKKRQLQERNDRPITPILGSPKVTFTNRPLSGRNKRREASKIQPVTHAWDGSTLHFYSQNPAHAVQDKNVQNYARTGINYRPGTASQDLNMLKRLDLSYAEVLRSTDNKKVHPEVRPQQHKRGK